MNSLCQHCNKAKATVHITDTTPHQRERHLCEECAEKEGVIVKQNPNTTNAVLQQFIKAAAGLSGADDVTCPRCGKTFREFQMKGVLGCPNDYDAFRELITPLLERAHEGATHHVGRVPPSADPVTHRETGLIRLRRELKEAVDQENYERAARVRDEIRARESSS